MYSLVGYLKPWAIKDGQKKMLTDRPFVNYTHHNFCSECVIYSNVEKQVCKMNINKWYSILMYHWYICHLVPIQLLYVWDSALCYWLNIYVYLSVSGVLKYCTIKPLLSICYHRKPMFLLTIQRDKNYDTTRLYVNCCSIKPFQNFYSDVTWKKGISVVS